MQVKDLQLKRALRTVLLVLLLGAAGIVKGYADYYGVIIGDLRYELFSNTQTATVIGHVDGTAATGTITIPETVNYEATDYSVTKISDDYGAFYGCSGLTGNLIIPNTVTEIGHNSFSGCTGFTGSLIIPNSVTTIGSNAFYGCTGFTGSLTIGNSVTSIDERAFQNCNGFTGNLTIGSSMTTIGDYVFSNCSGFTGSLIIPNSVTTIGFQSFLGCSGFTGSLTIPDSVTSIGIGAFSSCSGLTGSLNIPNSVVSIGNAAFSNCSGLSGSLIIPNSVSTIGNGAFNGCTGFTGYIVIPGSVIEIGFFAFNNCNGFKEMVMLGIIPPSLGNYGLNNTNFPIYVPYESLNNYKTATNWSNYEDRIYPMAYTTVSGYGSGNDKWAFIASPLTTQNLMPTSTGIENMITEATYDLYRFNQSAELEWQNYKAHTNDFTIANGQGYLYANQEDVNLIFKGTFNEGTLQDVGLTYDGTAQFAGWNLVGNPFPYAATVSRSYYVMNEDGTGLEPTPLSAGNTIAACTGIMVKADGENETVTFSKATRQNAVNNGLLHIAVANEDKAIISFNEDDELAKYVFNKDKAQIYIPQGTEEYVIAFSDKQHTMPLNFKAVKDGAYTLSINPQNAELDYLHLIDNLTGNDIDLLQTPDYTFNAKKTDYASRFRLVFSACGDADGDNDAPFAYISNGEIILTGVGADTCDVSLQVIDMQGRVLICRDARRASAISTNEMASGVYVLRLINSDEVKTQKIVID